MKRLTGRELLERLQIEAGYEKRTDITEEDVLRLTEGKSAVSRETAEGYIRYLKEMEQRLPTRYQSVWSYSLLEQIFGEMQAALERAKTSAGKMPELPPIPVFGTVRMGEFSAQIACSKKDEYLIVFSEGMFGFCNLFSKVIGDCFEAQREGEGYRYKTDPGTVRERIRSRRDIQRHFNDLILACMAAGHPHAAKQYFPSEELMNIASILCDGMEVFVAAHEYAHLVLGHLSCGVRSFSLDAGETPAGEGRIRKYIYRWADEIQADILAMEITMAVMGSRGYDRTLSFAGIGCAMLALDLTERIQNLKEGRAAKAERVSPTHPPAVMRRKELYERVRTVDGHAMELMGTIEEIVETLWENLEAFYAWLDSVKSEEARSVQDISYEATRAVIYRTDWEEML